VAFDPLLIGLAGFVAGLFAGLLEVGLFNLTI
jgi:hypothetical protein